ncbi:PTH1 family peptidyl-tRNA hydrolase [Entomoplasma freundtii]|uniref:Peptidyl-tRNA hydrolase n=1 Tax=Entomoplasma freundtii TaxID=74700 RepID=A0A2K8NQF6_9MOLU|nr:aminoacyl-tRNA hydrolase [Entomoplasma freundtii]ATZ16072.1 peptidyl-tRNA hydrolase [Entomoplasma freundtii]TDY58059.1 PTH1 family peptidyl-tRNA hydrolase [Entomoplasma freundtii]
MKLIVGLGNPGSEYTKTRHNAGFLMLDLLLDHYGYLQKKSEHQAITYLSIVNGEKVLFAYPQTYMNNSGYSVQSLAQYYKIPQEDILIIHDEKDFSIGKNQFRLQGSAGGHNGLKSIIQQLGNQNFKRLRLGIGKPPVPSQPLASWVLANFNNEDFAKLTKSFESLKTFLNDWTQNPNFQQIMTRYN